jgi:DNA-binding response OmpR family regulator
MRLAIIEDDPDNAVMLGRLFAQEGASLEIFPHGQQFLREASRQRFDLALLDLRLPDITGIEVLRRLKSLQTASRDSLPVMVVSGCAEPSVMESAFDLGARDYVLKPFHPAQVLIRARNIIRSQRPLFVDDQALLIDDIELDRSSQQVRRAGQEVRLSAKEFRLAWLLFSRKGEPVSRDLMLQLVWGRNDPSLFSRSLDTHIGRLRRKLQLGEDSRIRLRPVYGVGYRLDVFS